MYRFWETIIKPVLEMIDARSVLEIGAQNGYTTKRVIEYVGAVEGKVQSIDPFPNFDYKSWEKDSNFAFKMHIGLSLEVLPELPAFDVYLIDGDHNWYTVYNELRYAAIACGDKEILILLHDIGWPYARRDLYYNPETIPAEYRNRYDKKGIKYGYNELQDDGINGNLCNAIAYGTPRNGVLTAIEDFVNENPEYEFINIECCNGLGIIKKKKTYKKVSDYINNIDTLKLLIRQTEENRIEFFQGRYIYKNKYQEAMESLKKAEGIYLKEKDFLFEKMKDLSESCSMYEENNRILQEEAKKAERQHELKYELMQKELLEKCAITERSNQLLQEEKEKIQEEVENFKKQCSDIQRELSEKCDILEGNNVKLREEGRKSRKQCRDLQKELQHLYESRLFKMTIALSKAYHSPQKILSFITRKGVNSIRTKFFSKDVKIKNDVEEPKKENINNLYPDLSEYEKQSIYDADVETNTISLVICIHNALNDVIECLNSVWEKRTFPYEIILVDDGSDNDTRQYVEKYVELTGCKLHRNEEALGYTKSANIGLRMSKSDYVILLNSDTIVTDSWAEKMLNCFERHKAAGIVSPLSNAASYQSVPEIRDSMTGDWKINTLRNGMTIDMMGLIVEKVSKSRYSAVASLNGFCFMISRDVINAIGYLDEVNFPKGYGEEVDYCIRASKAGFELRIVDDTYIFHEKSKSFTHTVRKELGAASKPILKEKHGADVYSGVGKSMETCAELRVIREEIKEAIDEYYKKFEKLIGKKVAFVLTAKGGSGGANSVCQEVAGMRNLGIEVDIINSINYKTGFTQNYPEIAKYVRYFDKRSYDSFINVADKYDVVIATIFTTVKLIQGIKEKCPQIQVGYYIQDYEPYFFDKTEEYFQEAKLSYTRIPGMCLFAKTEWIADTVQKYHDVKVNLVEPSLDTRLYNPFVIKHKKKKARPTICAMVRPKTIRRNPKGTMEVLQYLKKKYDAGIRIALFGCSDEEIQQLGIFDFEYQNYGVLKRWEVAKLLAASDIFLDMSTYQAFGRTGLESMCLGCLPVLPKEGGVGKFARDKENAIIVDTGNVAVVCERICDVLDTPDKLSEMQQEGITTSKSFNVQNAVWSEIQMLNKLL